MFNPHMSIASIAQARDFLAPRIDRSSTALDRGEQLFRFLQDKRPDRCLELGIASGVGSVWIAAALEALGSGALTCVDTLSAHDRQPTAAQTVVEAGLTHRVSFAYEETSYTWYLHDRLREQVTADGRIEPLYDFVFLDGAHTWDTDGFTFFLLDRLLKPGGWILFDDMDWKIDDRWPDVPEYQKQLPQVREVYELLVRTHPDYPVLVEDGAWTFAQKSETGRPEVRTVSTTPLRHEVMRRARRWAESRGGS